jgi:hypothetical protein
LRLRRAHDPSLDSEVPGGFLDGGNYRRPLWSA